MAIDQILTRVAAEFSDSVGSEAVRGGVLAVSSNGNLHCVAIGATSSEQHDRILAAPFRIGCIGHGILAFIAQRLCTQQGLSLHVPVGTYVSDLADTEYGSEVTTAHLLAHSTGYVVQAQPAAGGSLGSAYFRPRQWYRAFEPGTCLNESSVDTFVLERVLLSSAGIPAQLLLVRELLEPLGVRQCAIAADSSQDTAGPASDSLTELSLPLPVMTLLLSSALASNAPGRVDWLLTPQSHLPPPIGQETLRHFPLSHGLGCGRFLGGLYGFNGAAHGESCLLRWDAELQLGIGVGLKSPNIVLRNRLLDRLHERLGGAETWSGRQGVAAMTDRDVELAVGKYVGINGSDTFTASVQRESARLACKLQSDRSNRALQITLLTRSGAGRWDPAADLSKISARLLMQSGPATALMLGSTMLWRTGAV